MPKVTAAPPRPLRDIVRDFELRGKPVTRALAEEAIASVAADGVIRKDEVDALLPYGDGPIDVRVGNLAKQRAGWSEGTRAGQALFNGLSDTIEELYQRANRDGPRQPTNPFSWWAGGWAAALAPTNSPPIDLADLSRRTRERSVGYVRNDVEAALDDYPKATHSLNTSFTKAKPDVQKRIDALLTDWKAGTVKDEVDLAGPLRPFLERKYR